MGGLDETTLKEFDALINSAIHIVQLLVKSFHP